MYMYLVINHVVFMFYIKYMLQAKTYYFVIQYLLSLQLSLDHDTVRTCLSSILII